MTDYTPTTEEVRGAYRAWHDGQGDDHARKPTWSEQEFDRWLASRDAEVRAKAVADCINEVRMIPCWAPKGDRDGGEFDLDGASHRRFVLEQLAEVKQEGTGDA